MPKSRRHSQSRIPSGAGGKDARPGALKSTPSGLYLCLLLAAITIIPFLRLLKCDFVNYDDLMYVTRNPHVQQLSARNLLWAFNVGYNSNWHPLTWMSFMLDYRLWGAHAAGYHAINLLLHIASVLLLFLILRRMTSSSWRSFTVAALFGIHPLHVESVAWIAERKDVLSTVFLMLTIGAYALYVERPSAKRYWAVAAMYALGLMAKPMLVSVPFVLLMLDYWPLGRIRQGWRLVWEKLPLLAMAGASCIVTVIAQQRGSATSTLSAVSVGIRISNAIVSYCGYIAKTVIPRNLAIFYPHPLDTIPIWKIVVSIIVLIAVTIVVVNQRRRRPYLLVGWMWYVVTLIPVIGLVQVGAQAMADRYTYVPLIGLFVGCVWMIPESLLETERRGDRRILTIVAGLTIVALAAITWIQVGYWRNSVTLFQHDLAVAPNNNYPAHAGLGRAYLDEHNYEAAASEYEKALALRKDEAHIFCEYGDSLANLGQVQAAIEQYHTALRVDPKLTQAQDRLTAIEQSQSEAALAQRLLQRAKDNPNSAAAHVNRGAILESQGHTEEAIREYKQAISLDPNLAAAHNNLAVLYDNHARRQEAIREFQEAIRLKPDFAEAHANFAVVLFMTQDYQGSLREVQLCRKLGGTPNPKLVQALSEKLPGTNP